MKSKIVSSLLTVAMVMVLSLSACSGEESSDDVRQEVETVSTKTVVDTKKAAKTESNVPDAEWTIEDVKELPDSIISGIGDVKIKQNANKADIASLVKYDKDVVKSVTVDDSKVKYNVPGTYEVVYMMEINLSALEKKAPESKTVKKTVTTITKGGGGEMKEDGFFTVSATVDITIVTTEEAEDLRDKGETVVTEKDTGVQKENDKNYAGNKNNSTSTTTKPESNKNNNNTASNTNSNKTESNTGSNKQDTNKTESKPSGSATKPSGSTDKPSKHTHNWVAHTETKVVKAAYDEPVYEEQPVYEDKPIYKDVPLYEEQPVYGQGFVCNKCGVEIASPDKEWMAANGHLGHAYSTKQIQTGTQSVQIGTESILVGMDQVQVGTEKVQIDTVHHDAVTETVTTYTCSCGATK